MKFPITTLRDRQIAKAMSGSAFTLAIGQAYQAARDRGLLEAPLHDQLFAAAETQAVEVARHTVRVTAALDVSLGHGIDTEITIRLINDPRLSDEELLREIEEIGRRTIALAGGASLSVLRGGLRDE